MRARSEPVGPTRPSSAVARAVLGLARGPLSYAGLAGPRSQGVPDFATASDRTSTDATPLFYRAAYRLNGQECIRLLCDLPSQTCG